MTVPLRLLVVDDDPLQARLIQAQLEQRGRARVDAKLSAAEAVVAIGRARYDAVITDLVMEGTDGIELTRRIRQIDPSLPVFILTASATLPRAVEGIRAGATDFLSKPAHPEALFALVERAVSERPVREEVEARERARSTGTGPGDMVIGGHPMLDEVRRFAEQVARVPGARVLITGESGTGKSLLARTIHARSAAKGRFVEINCAALPAPLLESELFGHEKGAFTDARTLKRGLIEVAHGGTLFLDEIGAMSLELQAKILLFMDGREIRRVGGEDPIEVDVRVIAATNVDLRRMVAERAFREDLFYRLDVASVEMPPLREMPGVIGELAARFVQEISGSHGRPPPRISPAAFAPLVDYPWPGNARELRNAVERALIFREEGELVVRPPARDPGELHSDGSLKVPRGLSLAEVERRYIEEALAEDPKRELADIADRLGISRKTLWEKRKRYRL